MFCKSKTFPFPFPIPFFIRGDNNYEKEEAELIFCQGGRTKQAFGGGKTGHETFRQARIYNFCGKCVVFARNLKFSNLTQ